MITVHELRKGVEALLPEAQDGLTYYEKWAASMVNIIAERGFISINDIEKELGIFQDEPEVKFKKGDHVKVRQENLATRWRRPHLRTPGYIFGAEGKIVEMTGIYHNPERVAFQQEGPKQPLYVVRFHQKDLWDLYDGHDEDTVDADIYQHWLEPSSEERAHKKHKHHHEHPHDHEHSHDHEHHHEHSHGHGESHSHAKGGVIDHGDHTHDARTLTEQKAVDNEGDDSERRKLSEAFIRVLNARKIITLDELRESVEAVDAWGAKAEGPRIVAKAWVDPDFKERLLRDTTTSLPDLKIPTSNYGTDNPNVTKLIVVENTPKVHNLVVCTLCSCYPATILGLSPPWYKSRSYRSRAVRDPRGTLKEFGLELPSDVAIQVHDSTADVRYLVLPERPAGTEGWNEEQLQTLVTRDSMIGVSRAKRPGM